MLVHCLATLFVLSQSTLSLSPSSLARVPFLQVPLRNEINQEKTI